MRHFQAPRNDGINVKPLSVLNVSDLTIADAQNGYRTGRFLPSDVVRACLARIISFEPLLNAFISLNHDALADAKRCDSGLKEVSVRRSPLFGIPVVIKDNMNEAGRRTTAGYAGFASNDRIVDPAHGAFNGVDLFPVEDATLVARLKAAGAIIIGKSNLPDFGLDGLRAQSSHNGDTLNPYGHHFAPGASSTGGATAVSAGFGIVAVGTDTAGSILFPASAQSLVGLKPTFGLVPIDGVFPGLSSHHDVAGPLARCVYDAAAMLDVMAGPTPKDPRTLGGAPLHGAGGTGRYVDALQKGAFKNKRIGLFEPGIWAAPLHSSVARHYEEMIKVIEGLGATLVPIVFGDTDWKERWASRTAFPQTNSYLYGVDAFLMNLGGPNPDSRAAFKMKAGFGIGLGTTAPLFSLLSNPEVNVATDHPKMVAVMHEAALLRQKYQDILSRKKIDALFVPRSVSPLPDITGDTLQYLADQVVGTEVNEMGLPAITMPAGFLEDGRPIAVDIVGRAQFTETELLALAFDFEQATQLRRPPRG